jgi:hypothetical protein
MATSLSRYLVEQQRAKNHIPPELRLLLEVVARACKSISHAVNKGALGGVLGSADIENVQGEIQKIANFIREQIAQKNAVGNQLEENINSLIINDGLNADARYYQSFDISNVESTWDGFTNTANLIAAGAGSGIAVGTAAELCNSSTNNGKSDWYLPAIDELVKIFQNRWDIAQGIITASGTTLSLTTYWSSTEFAIANAWGFNLSGGNAANSNKASTYYVRAVRKFSI